MKKKTKTHCKYGHKFTPENTYVRPSNGKRSCRTCLRYKSKAWRERNPEKYKYWLSRWYRNNKDRCRKEKRIWTAANLERERQRKRKWAQQNPDSFREAARKRRALKKSRLGIFSHMETQVIFLLRFAQNNKCYYCKKPLSVHVSPQDPNREVLEHPLPLSRGGTHGIENWVLSCFSCNARKGNRTEKEFMESIYDQHSSGIEV